MEEERGRRKEKKQVSSLTLHIGHRLFQSEGLWRSDTNRLFLHHRTHGGKLLSLAGVAPEEEERDAGIRHRRKEIEGEGE